MKKLEVWVHDSSITVVHKGQTVVTFSVTSENILHANVNEGLLDAVLWHAVPNLDQELVEVEIVTYERDEHSMAMPKVVRQTAKTRTVRPVARRPRSQALVVAGDTISDAQAKQIKNMILRSLKKNPKQTNAERAAETRRIANLVEVSVFAVAGVRANLTRGTYGNVKTLLANTK